MFKNMKIEINESQSVENIVIELERLGYKEDYMSSSGDFKIICTWGTGLLSIYSHDFSMPQHNKIYTLKQLKEMTIE